MQQHDPNSFDAMRIQAIAGFERSQDRMTPCRFSRRRIHCIHTRATLIGWYAQTLMAAGHPDQAEALVQDMLAHDKTWGPGYDFLFLLYRQQKNAGMEEAILREHIANDPSSPAAVENLANYLAISNRWDEAESLMKRTLADPEDVPARAPDDGRLLSAQPVNTIRRFSSIRPAPSPIRHTHLSIRSASLWRTSAQASATMR